MHTTTLLDPASLREQFDRDGYLVLEGYFTSDHVDRVRAAITTLIQKRSHEIVVDNLLSGERSFWAHATQKTTRYFKFNDLYLISDEVRELALDEQLSAILNRLLGERVVLCNSLNFEKGSSQPKHIDSLFMTPKTPHALIATWMAFEDAHPDSGPLVYFPGSHKIPLFRFQDGSHHAQNAEMPAWNTYIEDELRARNIPEKTFLAKKGDVFIWHSDLLHGGSTIKDPNRTRNSLVCHYYGENDCRKSDSTMIPLHHSFWMDRPRCTVYPAPELFEKGEPFPESIYLARYPDVKAAVAAGQFASGKDHYLAFGFKERRGV